MSDATEAAHSRLIHALYEAMNAGGSIDEVSDSVRQMAEAVIHDVRLTKREYFAIHSPVSFATAYEIFGGNPRLSDDRERAAFFAALAVAQREYADALLAELEKPR